MRKFDPHYEDGKCPIGFEYINAYTDFRGHYHHAYCRKLQRPRIDKLREKQENEAFTRINEESL